MKICCLPVRGVLHSLAILGILRSGAQIYLSSNVLTELLPVAYIAINSFLVYAVWKSEPCKLKWARWAVLLCLILTILPFLFIPIISTAMISSGVYENRTHVDDWLFGNHTRNGDRFFYGAMVGFTLEVGMGVLVAVEVFKYFLVTRVWKAEENMKYLVDPSTFVPPI